MSKHTPGPWRAFAYRDPEVVAGPDDGYTQVVRTSYRSVDPATEAETNWANAHLIAAAPDMLEALEALDALQDFGDTLTPFTALTFDDVTAINAAFVLALNAIKKARGQT